jgi:hypothetical protein
MRSAATPGGFRIQSTGGVAQWIEQEPSKLKVAGSIPAAPASPAPSPLERDGYTRPAVGSLSRHRLIDDLVELSRTLDELDRKLEVAKAIHEHTVAAEVAAGRAAERDPATGGRRSDRARPARRA